ncbi:hypothetical protein BC749_10476 [Flavobacterium araucananum]|nr:hypothetical protein BC749_10476 [Flavobacterium araucananum]
MNVFLLIIFFNSFISQGEIIILPQIKWIKLIIIFMKIIFRLIDKKNKLDILLHKKTPAQRSRSFKNKSISISNLILLFYYANPRVNQPLLLAVTMAYGVIQNKLKV